MGVNGAAWASVACHAVAFTIAITSLRKNIKLDLGVMKSVIKPAIATAIMGICSYFVYTNILGIISGKLATLVALGVAVVIYALALIVLKIFKKEEILMLPAGDKIARVLEKLKIY
ncbi:MAG: polysaccharide biosynthesis C-terminal domain-containing protein [Clostridia bacterium]